MSKARVVVVIDENGIVDHVMTNDSVDVLILEKGAAIAEEVMEDVDIDMYFLPNVNEDKVPDPINLAELPVVFERNTHLNVDEVNRIHDYYNDTSLRVTYTACCRGNYQLD